MRSGERLLISRPDWVRVIEALYAPVADQKAWAGEVLQALHRAFRSNGDGGAAMVVLEHDASHQQRAMPFSVGFGRSEQFNLQLDVSPLSRQLFDRLFYSQHLALTQAEVLNSIAGSHRRELDASHSRIGGADAVGLVAHPEPGIIAFMARPLAGPTFLTRYERRLLSQVTLHFESAFRLRHRPESLRAVLRPDGKIVHLDGVAGDPQVLSRAVRTIDRVRARRHRRDLDALELWRALVQGEASIVERFEGGARHYVVLENAPSRREHRALSRLEIEVARMAARGMMSKLIAYGLGVSTSAVSNVLASAAMKLGLSTRGELVRVASMLLDTPVQRVDVSRLTRTERQIYDMVRLGLSNDDIARARSRSVSTIAKQVSTVLQKTRSATRRAAMRGPSPA
jgi:DNA-binding NarL/FixJ family response regulator